MYRMHLHYDFVEDSYSVDITRDEGCYDGYTGRLTDTVYQDGTSWTDWNYYSSESLKKVMLKALSFAEMDYINFLF